MTMIAKYKLSQSYTSQRLLYKKHLNVSIEVFWVLTFLPFRRKSDDNHSPSCVTRASVRRGQITLDDPTNAQVTRHSAFLCDSFRLGLYRRFAAQTSSLNVAVCRPYRDAQTVSTYL